MATKAPEAQTAHTHTPGLALPLRKYGGEHGIQDAGGRSLATCRNDETADAIVTTCNEHTAASDFIRGCIEAVGYEEKPPEGFKLDTENMLAVVVGTIEQYKYEADKAEAERDALQQSNAALVEALDTYRLTRNAVIAGLPFSWTDVDKVVNAALASVKSENKS